MTMWLESYIEHLKLEGKSASTIRAVNADLHGLQRWWEGSHQRGFDIRHLTQRDVRRWVQHRQQVDAARPSTINRGLSSLRTCSRWAVSEGLLIEDATAGAEEVASVQVTPAGLPPIAIDELLRSAALTGDPIQRRRDEACLALLIYGGLRIQECCHVQVRAWHKPAALPLQERQLLDKTPTPVPAVAVRPCPRCGQPLRHLQRLPRAQSVSAASWRPP